MNKIFLGNVATQLKIAVELFMSYNIATMQYFIQQWEIILKIIPLKNVFKRVATFEVDERKLWYMH